MATNNTIQVYEYTSIEVGFKYQNTIFEKPHYLALAKYITKNPECSFYTVYYNKIRFCNYVGILKVGDITIEVLPKTDRHEGSDAQWQNVLLEMLAISLNVKATTTTDADIHIRKHTVLETYLQIFLTETKALLHKGLVKKYRNNISNQTALKGRLLIHQHISKNIVHAERFYVSHQVYDRDNIYNSILQQALQCLISIDASESLTKTASNILIDFPKCKTLDISLKLFERLSFDRKTEHYKKAIEIAKIILLNFHPDLKGGRNNILAIMFDMNLLWEIYIYKMISTAAREYKIACLVNRKQKRAFWKHPDDSNMNLEPDIIISYQHETYILDTKWKYKRKTSIEDIRQMYAYGHYWEAKKRYLLYPDKVANKVVKNEGAFYEVGLNKLSEIESCGIIYIDILNDDMTLNKNIGSVILEEFFRIDN